MWTWTAIDVDSTMILSYGVGDRSGDTSYEFMVDLSSRLANRAQLTTDGHHAYLDAVEGAFGGDIDYAMLAEATAAFRAALTVYTKDDHPVQWAMTQENLALAEEDIADHDSTADPRPHLEAALAHVEAALTVFDPEHMSYEHAKATRIRDRLRARLAELPDG